ncbi:MULTISPECIES: protein kinase family protein [Phenylobacterium]|uniref:Protein kinase domain-containing protein n=1 Tax=Phenylobacterium koreense TaxID=266125 RepID=A0ABV2EH80_9CAUL
MSAYLQASDWALSGACPYFPLLHHWRVESRASRPPLRPEQLDWLEKAPAYWDGSDAVRARLDAIAAAPASLVLFLEHVPETLDAWMARRLEAGLDPALEARALSLHNQVQEAAAFMNAQGMLHFDLHAFNVLTDGEQSYVADFGLALCAGFQLSADERAFFETHRLYDRCFAAWDFAERLTARTAAPAALPSEMRAMVERHTDLTGVFGRFFRGLTDGRKSGPYPAAELEAAFAALT